MLGKSVMSWVSKRPLGETYSYTWNSASGLVLTKIHSNMPRLDLFVVAITQPIREEAILLHRLNNRTKRLTKQ